MPKSRSPDSASTSAKDSSAGFSAKLRVTSSVVPTASVTVSRNFPETPPAATEVTVNSVVSSGAAGRPVTLQASRSSESPAGSAGRMEHCVKP